MTVSRTGVTVVVLAVLLTSTAFLGAAQVAETGDRAVTASNAANETTTTTTATADATIVADGDELVLQPEANQTIRGETTAEPGTNLTVQVQGDQFIRTSVVTVTEQGTFDVTIDLHSAHDQQLTIRVVQGETPLTTTSARVACAGECETTQTTDDWDETTTTTADGKTEGLFGELTSGVGMIAVGGLLAVAGIGVLLGLFRN